MKHGFSISLDAFQLKYGSSEEAWADYFYQVKWPSGYSCPQCGHREAYTIHSRKQPLYQCRSCSHQTSLTAGTIFEGTRTSLVKWAYAIHIVACSDIGINAVQLQSLIGVTYKTAWAMLNKIRQAISSEDTAQPLSGFIQAGVAFCGKFQASTFHLTGQEHPVIFADASSDSAEHHSIKIKLVSRSHMDGKMLTPMGCTAFIRDHVVSSDETPDIRIANSKYRSRRLGSLVELMSRFRIWVNHTFHGLGAKRLQGYLDEFCFRQNYGNVFSNVPDHLARICMSFKAS
ncbi:transposase [Paenibacillus tarimensis]